MTRKQAEKIARTLVERARKENASDPLWTRCMIHDAKLAEKVREWPQGVWGCLPRGWVFSLHGYAGIEIQRPPVS